MNMKFFLLILPTVCVAHPILNSESCKQPENFESLLSTYQAEDTLSIILPLPIQRGVEIFNTRSQHGAETLPGPDQLLYGNKTCPGSITHQQDAVEERSKCPYYYVISQDLLRYPVAIAEARCKCMYCMDDWTGENLCENVYFPKTVLRRQKDCVNGTYVYKPETYYVQNACVCAKRRFAVSEAVSGQNNDQQEGDGKQNNEENRAGNRVEQTSTTTAETRFTFA